MQNISIESVQKPDCKMIEEIRRLRTNLNFLEPDQKVINITSTIGKEGKSLISFWLAHSLSELGKKVVLLDANLRSKKKDDVYMIKLQDKKNNNKKDKEGASVDSLNLKGLTEYLQGNIKKEEIIYSSDNMNMDLVLSGSIPSNPSELLSSIMLKDLMNYLKDNYDYVIVDTPALGEVTDAAIIAAHCDSSILVLEPGVTPYKLAQKAKEQLENSGTKLLGVVLNKA